MSEKIKKVVWNYDFPGEGGSHIAIEETTTKKLTVDFVNNVLHVPSNTTITKDFLRQIVDGWDTAKKAAFKAEEPPF